MVFRHVADIAAGVVGAAYDARHDAVAAVLKNTGKLNAMLEKAAKNWEPITVTALCRQNDTAEGGFVVELDHDDLHDAISADRWRPPQLVIKSFSDEIDRDKLAEKLEVAFRPLVESYQAEVDEAKMEKARQRFWSGFSLSLGLADLGISMLGLAVIGAGAVIGPLLMLGLAIGGIQFLKELPSLLISVIMGWIFGSEIDQMQAEVNRARKLIKTMIKRADIEVDETLAN